MLRALATDTMMGTSAAEETPKTAGNRDLSVMKNAKSRSYARPKKSLSGWRPRLGPFKFEWLGFPSWSIKRTGLSVGNGDSRRGSLPQPKAAKPVAGSFPANKNRNLLPIKRIEWRPRPELNWCTRFCRPLRNHSATWPHRGALIYALSRIGNQATLVLSRAG